MPKGKFETAVFLRVANLAIVFKCSGMQIMAKGDIGHFFFAQLRPEPNGDDIRFGLFICVKPLRIRQREPEWKRQSSLI